VAELARVIPFPRRLEREVPLTYPQLCQELGVSKRFLQDRVKEGMPDEGLDFAGRRRFLLSKAIPWLDARQQRLGRTMRDAHSPRDGEAS
jgi:hypothetical protein